MKIVSLDRTIPLFYFSFLCAFLERSNTEVQPPAYELMFQNNWTVALWPSKLCLSGQWENHNSRIFNRFLLAECKVRAEELGSVYT